MTKDITMTTSMQVRIPGSLMEHCQGSSMTITPEDSGYSPSLGHKLNAAKAIKTGKGYSYVVDLTEQEADELAEFASDALAPARDSEDRALLNAALKVMDRVERERERIVRERHHGSR